MARRSRTLSLAVALSLAVLSSQHASAFSACGPTSRASAPPSASALAAASCAEDSNGQTRRAVLSSLFSVTSAALGASFPAHAGLLDDYGADPNVSKEPAKPKEQARNKGKAESNMEPNLRSNYYYPTNKGTLQMTLAI